MTTKAKEKQEQERGPLNKYYRSTRHISWIEIIPKYISPREAAALSTEEKERLLKPFERPRFPSRINKQVPLLLPRSQTYP
jgi:hypothetical protein